MDQRQGGPAQGSGLDSDQDIDAALDCGVAVLRASGRLRGEDDGADRALVLAIIGATMPAHREPYT